MKIVGLTGGIGSGKSTVAEMFADLGIPVYIADDEAKRITNTSKIIRRKLVQLLGKNAYKKDSINSEFVAKAIFGDKELLEKVNSIIHPKVASHFKRWVKKQKGPYCIKEAAILFESGSYTACDEVILITAPKRVRLQRVLKRDGGTKADIEARMANQWSDRKKKKLADYVIENTDLEETASQVKKIHRILS